MCVGIVLMLLCIHITLFKKCRPTQKYILYVVIFSILALLMTVIWCWYTKHEIQEDYNPLRGPFITADNDGCITSVAWSKVLKKFVEKTSFSFFSTVLLVLLVIYGSLFVIGTCVLCYIISRIGELRHTDKFL